MAMRRLSAGFTGPDTRGLTGLDREIEYRLGNLPLDAFTDDFSPPGTPELAPGQNPNKRDAPYEKPHDDFVPEADRRFTLSAAGKASDQPYLDEIDATVQKYYSQVKNPEEQFPGALTLKQLSEGVDERLWEKAKEVSKAAFSRIRWPFVSWYYSEHGGK